MSLHSLRPATGRFLHLVHDEKYIDAARSILEEAAPGAHDYLVVGSRPAAFRHLRTFTPVCCELDVLLRAPVLRQLPDYSAVLVHALDDAARLVVDAAPASTRFLWMAWGSDYYHLLRAEHELLLPRTSALVDQLRADPAARSARLAIFGGHLAGLARATTQPWQALGRYRRRRTLRHIGAGRPGEIDLLNRFHGFAVTPEDFDAVKQAHPAFGVPLLDWSCYWAEPFDPDRCPDAPSGGDVLLGNSATPTNNHLEALEILAEALPAGRRVVCPLSYGDHRYGDAIEAAGRRLLGDRFVPLRKFMDPAAYAQVVGACSVVVMNHRRQQAVGNIVVALCSGAHVFLRPDNSAVATLRRLGVEMHDMAGLADFLRGADEAPLPAADLAGVRRKIGSRFGRPAILARTRVALAHLAQALPRQAA